MVKIFTHESEHEFGTSKVQFSMPAPLHNQETARVNHKSFLYHPETSLLKRSYSRRIDNCPEDLGFYAVHLL